MNIFHYLGWLFLVATIYLGFWTWVAGIVATSRIFDALQRRAAKTPYWHLEGYMERWWLFNPIKTTYVRDDLGLNTVRVVKSPRHPGARCLFACITSCARTSHAIRTTIPAAFERS